MQPQTATIQRREVKLPFYSKDQYGVYYINKDSVVVKVSSYGSSGYTISTVSPDPDFVAPILLMAIESDPISPEAFWNAFRKALTNLEADTYNETGNFINPNF